MKISRNQLAAAVVVLFVCEAAPLFAQECLSSLGRYARGWSEAVAANGSEFIFGDGSALVIRHTDGSLTEVETGAMVVGLEVVDGYVYVAGDGGLRIIDLLAPDGPAVIGRCAMPGVAESVEVFDGRAYVAGGGWGMRVVDVSIPTDPVEIGAIDAAGWSADAAVAVLGGSPFAVIANSWFGLVVVDAGEPEELDVVAYVDIGDDGGGAVETTGNHAIAVDPRGNFVTAVDLSAPAEPQIVDSLDLGFRGNTPGLAVDGAFAYVAGKHFFIIDVSDPTRLSQIASVEDAGYGKDAAAHQGQVTVATGDMLRFIDASDPQNPVEGEPLRVGDHPIQASGITATERHVIGFSKEMLVIPTGVDPTPGLRIFDVDNPRHPVVVGESLEDHFIADAEAIGSLVYTVTQDGFFRVVDLADVSQPQELGVVPLPSYWHRPVRFIDLDVDGDLAVVVGSDGLVVVDISDPTNPTRSGGLSRGFHLVELVGQSAFVTDDEIRLVDLTNPSVPFLVDDGLHQLKLPYGAVDLEVIDGYAFVLCGEGFLPVIDVDTNDGWAEVGLALVPGGGSFPRDGVMSSGRDRLVVAHGWHYGRHDVRYRSELAVYDISDPAEPVYLDDGLIPGEHVAVMLKGMSLFATDEWGGLGVYSMRRCLLDQQMPPEIPASSAQ